MEFDIHLFIAQLIGGMVFFWFTDRLASLGGYTIRTISESWKGTLIWFMGWGITFYVPLIFNRWADDRHPVLTGVIITSFVAFAGGWALGLTLRDIKRRRQRKKLEEQADGRTKR